MSGKQAISESDVEEAMRFWVQPLLTSASEVFLYRRRPWVPDIPSRLKAVILGKTKARSKLDFRQMELHTHWSFWSWTLKRDWHLHFVVGERHLAALDLAKHAWDPAILGNLGTAISRNAVSFAKKMTETGPSVCLLFFSDAYGFKVAVFAPRETLLKLFKILL